MIIVFSAVLLNCIEIIAFDELTSSYENKTCTDKSKCILRGKNTTEEYIQVTRDFDSREWFHFTTEKEIFEILRTPKKPRVPHPAEGAFFNFTLDMFETILNKLPFRKIGGLFSMLGRNLKGSSTSRRRSCESFLRYFVKRLSRKSKILSRKKASKIKEKVTGLINDTLEEKPRRMDFFLAMNSLFTWKYEIKLHEYIYYLHGYAKGREGKRLMNRQTKLMIRHIFYVLDKQRSTVRNDVIMKLMLAYEEYYRK